MSLLPQPGGEIVINLIGATTRNKDSRSRQALMRIDMNVNSNQKIDHCGNEKVDHPKVVKSGCFLHFLSQFIVTFPETVRFPLKNSTWTIPIILSSSLIKR